MGVLGEPNEDRELHASIGGVVYARHPTRTHLVTADDDAAVVVQRYVGDLGSDVRLVAISERMVAITQGRSYPIRDITPSPLARLLERFVTRPGYGIGLGFGRDHGARNPRGRGAAHPAGRGAVGRDQAVRGARHLLPRRRARRRRPSTARPATRFRRTTMPPRSVRRTPTAPRDRSLPYSTRRSRSSTPTMRAARCWVPARVWIGASSSACLRTTPWARRASRRRSAWCARLPGRLGRRSRPSRSDG